MDESYLDTVIYDNFYELLKGRCEDSGEKPAIQYMEGQQLISMTYMEMTRQIACVYRFLRESCRAGGHVGILSENRYEYIVIYLAAVFGHVIVPLDKELDAQTLAGCAEKFDIDLMFYTDKTKEKAQRAGAHRAINIDETYARLVEKDAPVEPFFREVSHTDKDRFAILASTSGTDGQIKGVMLSQYNVITNIRGTLENNVLKNPTLAFLPMNHTYGFNPCILATLYNGTTVCLNLEMKHLMRDLRIFDPYFFGAVPMVIEGMYDNILRQVKRQKKEKSFEMLIAVSQFFLKFHIDLRHLFFGGVINKRLRLIVNGGAALSREYVDRFGQLGITVLNGYGLTECSPTIAVSRERNNVPGSAGTIMKHIDVRIADDGEILVKGPNVMLGYYKDAAATKACMRGGYFATGDIGHTDGKVLFVTGRKKNLIILENGKNVPPEYLEERLDGLPYVKESLIVPKKVAGRSHILQAKVVLEDAAQAERFEADLRRVNETLPSYMRVDDYEIRSEAFARNSSGKIKRDQYV